MKKTSTIFLAVIVLIGIMTLFSGFYTVNEWEQTIITRFQAIKGETVIAPGLHWKIPFIEKANKFEKRWLEWDGASNQIPTADKRFIWVDCYARWRISDAKLFFERVRDEEGAQSRLDDILDGMTRNAIAKYNLMEIIRSSTREFEIPTELVEFEDLSKVIKIEHGRAKIMKEILEAAKDGTKELGIELVDFKIKRIIYIDDVLRKVYERMISERQRIAQRYRSEGQGESEKIIGDMQKELKRIRSEAYRSAQEIKGRGDAEATRIYADAYNRDPEFYSFMKTLETYVKTMDKETWLVMTTDGELFKYLMDIKD